ncbi:MAG: hypothetical protein WBQ86_07550, partial [Candidatus Binatus sp.]
PPDAEPKPDLYPDTAPDAEPDTDPESVGDFHLYAILGGDSVCRRVGLDFRRSSLRWHSSEQR